jgi:hypothetical protein
MSEPPNHSSGHLCSLTWHRRLVPHHGSVSAMVSTDGRFIVGARPRLPLFVRGNWLLHRGATGTQSTYETRNAAWRNWSGPKRRWRCCKLE